MLRVERVYPSDLSHRQWNAIQNLLPKARGGGRPRSVNLRRVVDAIFYLVRSGCAWRYLPKTYPPWQSVYGYFKAWQKSGVLQNLHDRLRSRIRRSEKRKAKASTLIIDSQTIKAASGEARSYDGYKKVRGRKRHILVDTLGMLHAVSVHEAGRNDTLTGELCLAKLSKNKNLKRIYADHGYRGTFSTHCERELGFLPIVPPVRKDSGQGKRKKYIEKLKSKTLRKEQPKKRWIVERTFAWFNHYRRLSRDFERKTPHSEAMIYLAMIQLILSRLYRGAG